MINFLKFYLFRLKLRILLKLYKINLDCPYLAAQRYIEFSWVMNNLNFKSRDIVLDIGSANSILPTFLTNKFNISLYAIDLDESIKDQIVFKNLLKLNNLQVLKVDGVKLPFKDNFFNKVISVSAVEHFEGDKDILALKEIYRILKKGGTAVITTQITNEYEEIFKEEDVYSKKYKNTPVFFERRYDEENLEKRILTSSPLVLKKIKYFMQKDNAEFFNFSKFLPLPGLKIFFEALKWKEIQKLKKHIFEKGPICCILFSKKE